MAEANPPIDPIDVFNQLSTPSSISKNEFYEEAPKLRFSHEALGKLLLMPQSGLVVVPYEQSKGGWYVTVVKGNSTYPVGGHNLYVSKIEIESALEYSLGELLPPVPRVEPDENSIFAKIRREQESD